MKSLNSLSIFVFAFLLALPAFAGDKGYVGEEGTEIEVSRISSPSPEYPRRAIRLGVEGSVRLEFDVDTDGSVLDPYVVDIKFVMQNGKIISSSFYQRPRLSQKHLQPRFLALQLPYKHQPLSPLHLRPSS